MNKKPEKKQSGRVNYIWVLAGGYLIYVAYKLIRGLFAGDGLNPLATIPFIVIFLVVGGLVLLREWKAYKYGMDHIDDPDSWNDGDEDEALDAELAEIKAAALEASEEEVLEETKDTEELPVEDEEEKG